MFIRKKRYEELKNQYQADIHFLEKRISDLERRIDSHWRELDAASFCRKYPSGYALFFCNYPYAVYINWRDYIEDVRDGKICYLVYARAFDVNFVCVCKLPKSEGYFLHSAKVTKETGTDFLIDVDVRRRILSPAYGAGETIEETHHQYRVYKRTGDVEKITGKED